MAKFKIGLLHPGAMGISLAASAQNAGHTVYWVSEGRSPQTHERAVKFDLIDARSMKELCDICAIIISVCPPHAAEEVARQVISNDFSGHYVDANAIAPRRAMRIGRLMDDAGVSFIDGGIIGGPAWESGKTCFYLSGVDAEQIAACFSEGPLETCILDDEIGKASAIKMCYAAYTKGSTALLCAILATAEQLRVQEDLERHWSRDGSDFAQEARNRVVRVTSKAWRFAGEMEEIATTFEDVGMPREFHQAAGEIYRRMAHYKGLSEAPIFDDVLKTLRSPG